MLYKRQTQPDDVPCIIQLLKCIAVALKNTSHKYMSFIVHYFALVIGVTKERRRLKEFYTLKYVEAII